MVFIEFKIVQIYINGSDKFLKIHVSNLKLFTSYCYTPTKSQHKDFEANPSVGPLSSTPPSDIIA